MFFDRDFGGGGNRRPFPNMDPGQGQQGRFPSFPRDRGMPGFEEFGYRHPMFGRNSPFEDPFENGFPNRERNNSGSSGAHGTPPAASGKEHVIPIKVLHTTSTPPGQEHTANQSPQPSQTTDVLDKGKKQSYSQQRNTTEIPHPKVAEVTNMNRNQRAQSAPPETGNSPQQTSEDAPSPNIAQCGAKSSKSDQPEPAVNGIRHIPIFVEGRKGPVVNGNPSSAVPTKTKPSEQIPRKENIQQPSDANKSARSTPEDVGPSKKPTLPKTQLELIQEVLDDVRSLAEKVKSFKGTYRDKEYLYLDEMLTRDLIKLDLIDTEGKEDIRVARKNCIKEIQETISNLESIAKPVGDEEKVESTEAMEVEPIKADESCGATSGKPDNEVNSTTEVEFQDQDPTGKDVSPAKPETQETVMETESNEESIPKDPLPELSAPEVEK